MTQGSSPFPHITFAMRSSTIWASEYPSFRRTGAVPGVALHSFRRVVAQYIGAVTWSTVQDKNAFFSDLETANWSILAESWK